MRSGLKFEAPAGALIDLLAKRNILIEYLDSNAPTETEASNGCDRLNALDNRILATPSASIGDVFAKLLLVVQLRVEGSDTSEERAAAIVREARALAGAGRISPNVCVQREV